MVHALYSNWWPIYTADRSASEKSYSVTRCSGMAYACLMKKPLLRYLLCASELVSRIGTPDGISKVVSTMAHSPTTPPFSRVSIMLFM